MNFKGVNARLRKTVGDQLNKAIADILVATAEAASLALELAKRAKQDVSSSRDNYKKRRFAKAVEDLQQAVEKGAKAFGLLTGTVKPTDAEMREIGHESFKAFILHFWDFYLKLLTVIRAESEALNSELLDYFALRGMARKLRQIIETAKQAIAPEGKLKLEIAELLKLDPATMWKASIELDETNKWIGSAMSGMQQKVLITDKLQTLINKCLEAISLARVLDEEALRKAELAVAVGKTGQKLFSLSLLTCWHHEAARYPPAGRYWDLSAYNELKPFIRAMPNLTKHAEAAIDSAIEASEMALIFSRSTYSRWQPSSVE